MSKFYRNIIYILDRTGKGRCRVTADCWEEIWLLFSFFFMRFRTKINKHKWFLLTTNSQHVTVFSTVFLFIFPLSSDWKVVTTGKAEKWDRPVLLPGETRNSFTLIHSQLLYQCCVLYHNSLFRHLNWPLMTINNWTTLMENCTNLS